MRIFHAGLLTAILYKKAVKPLTVVFTLTSRTCFGRIFTWSTNTSNLRTAVAFIDKHVTHSTLFHYMYILKTEARTGGALYGHSQNAATCTESTVYI